jgi:acyl dehydratase
MAIDPAHLLAMPPVESHQRLTPREVMLYALALGAEELAFAYEDGLAALPTIAATLAYPGFYWRDPALGADWRRILHGEVSIVLHAPLPVEGQLTGATVIDAIHDKGADKGAAVHQTRTIRDAQGTLIATVRNTSMLRGDGGHGGGGDPAPRPHPIPDRAPDLTVALPTRAGQALLYRLASGDSNPLHVDPAVARAGGFDRPILHGLCTFGVAGRVLLAGLADNEPGRIRRIDARFSAPVYPGETIVTQIWREAEGRAAYRARVAERDLVVLNNGYVEYS